MGRTPALKGTAVRIRDDDDFVQQIAFFCETRHSSIQTTIVYFWIKAALRHLKVVLYLLQLRSYRSVIIAYLSEICQFTP